MVAAAVGALALAGTAIVACGVAAGNHGGPGLPKTTAGPVTAPFFVTLDSGAPHEPAVVHDAVTGRVTTYAQPPSGGRFTNVAAGGDDRMFVLADLSPASATRFYELRITARGGSARLSALAIPLPRTARLDGLAVTADVRRLAVALSFGNRPSLSEIKVVNLVTRAARTWRANTGSAANLSWAGSHTLAFEWSVSSHSVSAAERLSGVRILDTSRPGGDLMASKLVISDAVTFRQLSGADNPVIAPNGSVIFATMVSAPAQGPVAAVAEFSARTGRVLRIVTPSADESGFGTYCGILWISPSAAQALAACGRVAGPTQGRIDDGKFTPMNLHFPAPNFGTPADTYFAW